MFNVGEISANVTADQSKFNAAMKEVHGHGKATAYKIQRNFEVLGKKFQAVGDTLKRRLTLPLLAVGGLSTKIAGDFEQSFADIRKTVDATESQFASMEKELRSLAKTVPTPVEELNRLAGVAGQLGVQQKNIVEFTKVIAMLGDATDIAGEQAALSLSRFMNVMGTAQTDIDRVGSTIVGLGNNFAAMESEIVDIATSMAAFGNQMGLNESQVLAFSAAIAASGGQTEAAATAFQKTASTMQQAVIEGNKDLQTFANVAGVSAQRFSEVFRKDAAGALQLFLKGLKNVADSGQSTASILDDLGLADQRLQREFGKLTGNLDQLDDALVQANKEWESNTALTEEAQKRYKTFNSQMSIFKNTAKDLGITIGNELIPLIKSMADFGKTLIARFQALSPSIRKNILAISGFAAAAGPVIGVLGAISAAIGAISTPILAAVAAIGAGTALIIRHWDEVSKYFTSGGGAEMWETLKETVTDTVKLVTALWDMFGEELMTLTKDSFTVIVDIVDGALKQINNLVGFWSKVFVGDFRGALGEVGQAFEDWSTSVIDIVLGIGKALGKWLWFINPPRIAITTLIGLFRDAGDEGKKFGTKAAEGVGILNKEFASLINRAKQGAGNEGLFNIFEKAEGNAWKFGDSVSHAGNQTEKSGKKSGAAKTAVDELTNSYKNFSVVASKPVDFIFDFEAIRAFKEEIRMLNTPIEDLMNVETNFADKIFPPGSLGALQERLTLLREQLSFAVDPEKISMLKTEIGLTQSQIEALIGTADSGGQAMMGLANSIGNMFSQAVLHGSKLGDVVKNMLKQLASRAFITGIGALLTGGTSLAGGSFLSALFGGFRAGGGPVSGGMSYVVGEQGPEIFTPSRSGSIIPNSGSVSGGGGMSASAMKNAFKSALRETVIEVSPSRVFELSESGRRGY